MPQSNITAPPPAQQPAYQQTQPAYQSQPTLSANGQPSGHTSYVAPSQGYRPISGDQSPQPAIPVIPKITRTPDGGIQSQTTLAEKLTNVGQLQSNVAFLNNVRDIIQKKQQIQQPLTEQKAYWRTLQRDTSPFGGTRDEAFQKEGMFTDERFRELSPGEQSSVRASRYAAAGAHLQGINEEETWRKTREEDIIRNISELLNEKRLAEKEAREAKTQAIKDAAELRSRQLDDQIRMLNIQMTQKEMNQSPYEKASISEKLAMAQSGVRLDDSGNLIRDPNALTDLFDKLSISEKLAMAKLGVKLDANGNLTKDPNSLKDLFDEGLSISEQIALKKAGLMLNSSGNVVDDPNAPSPYDDLSIAERLKLIEQGLVVGDDGNLVRDTSGATAKQIADAMKMTESNGNYNAKGASGEYGAYQFMPRTWEAWSEEYSKANGGYGQTYAMTPENQDKIAQFKVQQYLDKGYTPEQIAAAWNGGEGVVAGDRWKTMVSTGFGGTMKPNSAGVEFSIPNHVKKVMNNLNKVLASEQPTTVEHVTWTEAAVRSLAPKVGIDSTTLWNNYTDAQLDQLVMEANSNQENDVVGQVVDKLKPEVLYRIGITKEIAKEILGAQQIGYTDAEIKETLALLGIKPESVDSLNAEIKNLGSSNNVLDRANSLMNVNPSDNIGG